MNNNNLCFCADQGIRLNTLRYAATGLLFGLLFSSPHASEDDYNRAWCAKMNEVPNLPAVEYRIQYKDFYEVKKDYFRVDCIVKNKYAVEMDFGKNWLTCYSQARAYGEVTGLIPGCVLVIGKGEEHFRDRLEHHAHKQDRYLEIWTMPRESLPAQ